ncbi:MAG: phosphotransferase [Azospirillaceae bacterium]|nr:phosphotransferase [Azospirillaceae bacterium]
MTDAEVAARIDAFLATQGWGAARRIALAGDASARRYWRLERPGDTAILACSPPPARDSAAFVAVAGLLRRISLSAPRILAAAPQAGLLLLEDFGDTTFGAALAAGADAETLYALAVDVLIALHRRFTPRIATGLELPVFDAPRFAAQVDLFGEICLPIFQITPAAADTLGAAWRAVLPLAERLPTSLLLRDYHVDNLMLLSNRSGVAGCGLLDFQDAGLGPVAYDLVSLLEDARRDLSETLTATMIERYRDAFPALATSDFAAGYAVLGAMRHARIIGIFIRLARQDGKRRYLEYLPRVWRQLDAQLRHPALALVAEWISHHLPPDRRAGLFSLETVR